MKRPITTLFLLISVDGKISTGATDNLDVDKDFPIIDGVKEGLHQYYEIERTTDLWSLSSGRVQSKIGANERPLPDKGGVSFVVIDNSHLNANGLMYFAKLAKTFVLVTSNKKHVAFEMDNENINIIYQEAFDPEDMLERLHGDYGCDRITIQTGGTLNDIFFRAKLLDYIDIVIAPILIGGKNTASLIDGYSLLSHNELDKLGVLKLEECLALEDSYVRLRYKVIA
jgi:2,5-diamino-6-(ribosylamino)-4(3H)-pyrimidinone 5'-phosphate reductase